MTGAEHETESDELSQNILGLIDAYGMGAALDTQSLYPVKSGRVSLPEPATG